MTESTKTQLAFPSHLAELRTLMPQLVAAMEVGTGFYAFSYLHESKSLSASADKTESTGSGMDRGMVLRIVADQRNFETATNDLRDVHLQKLANDLKKTVIREVGEEKVGAPSYLPPTWSQVREQELPEEIRSCIPEDADETTWVDFGTPCIADPDGTTAEGLLAKTRELKAAAEEKNSTYRTKRDLPELAIIGAGVSQSLSCSIFVDRCRNMSQTRALSVARAYGLTVSGKSAYRINGGMGGAELADLSDDDLAAVGSLPYVLDEAEKLTPGNYQIITGPDVTGVIAHEAFGHTQEGDTCLQGRSISPGLRADGVKVGNDQATIINNPALFRMGDKDFGCNGTYYFDHEGQLATKQVILDKGTLSEPMTDLLTSIKLGVPRTPNGKRESWRRPTLTRQTNTYFTPGDKTLDELIGMVKGTAYLAPVAHGGMEDPKGGNLTAGTSYLEEIVDGKLTGRFFVGPQGGHVELSGYVPDLLDGIIAKSKVDADTDAPDQCDEPENKLGGCGKYHKESVSAGCGGPYILWKSITCG